MEIILNRWRGTGDIFYISKFAITGTMIYAFYLGLLFGSITEWYIGILVLIGFLIGESFGWGKWVGSLCYPENTNLQKGEIEESVWLDEIQKNKDENKPKTETSNES